LKILSPGQARRPFLARTAERITGSAVTTVRLLAAGHGLRAIALQFAGRVAEALPYAREESAIIVGQAQPRTHPGWTRKLRLIVPHEGC